MTGLLNVKLRRDMRASRSRFALMVIAIAISLTVFGGVLCAWAAMSRETRGAYLSTEPASATIMLDQPVDAGKLAAIAADARTRPGVLQATARTQFDTDIEVNGQPRRIPLQVFVAAPDDPMRMAKVFVRQGEWPPAPGDILLGKDSLALLGVAVGDTLTATAPGGQRLRLRVAGTVYDPSLSPSPQEQRGHAYLSTASLTIGLDQLKIQVGQAAPSRDRDAIVATASEVGTWLQRDQGLAVREIQVPKPYAHPHQWQADALLLSLLAGGAAALLLATILVANMLNTLFTQQIPQIGIMKAIGVRSVHIGRLYLTMTLVVAAAATLVALPLAVLLGRVGVTNFLGFLGIQASSLAAPWWTYLVIIAVGLGLPPLLALVPLIKASRTTVRAAIDHHGGGSRPGAASGVLARLSRRTRLDRGLLMALRNTIRRPARFWLSVGLLASAGIVFVAGMSLSTSTTAIDDERKAERTWDVEVQLGIPAAAGEVSAAVKGVPGVTRVEGWNRSQVGVAGPGQIPVTRTYPDQGHGSVSLAAIPPDASMPPRTVLEGRWLNPDETGAVVLNQITRNNTVPGLHAGDTVQLFLAGRPTTWRIAGIVEEREGGSGGVYTTAAGLADTLGQPPRVNQLRVTTANHDEPTRTAIADTIGQTLAAAGIAVKSAVSVSRADAVSAGHLGPVVLILLGIAVPLGVLGAIGLATTMGANILDRTREFGIMHAIGAQPRTVRRIVAAEGIFLALTSCVVAILPALGLTALLGAGLGNLFFSAPLPYRISVLAVAIWLGVSILGAILATDAAATRASRLTIREALTYL